MEYVCAVLNDKLPASHRSPKGKGNFWPSVGPPCAQTTGFHSCGFLGESGSQANLRSNSRMPFALTFASGAVC
jgi:hypothetical protein